MNSAAVALKLAVTWVSAAMVMAQGAVPLHPPPDQPAKVEEASGVGVRVTVAPSLITGAQLPGQLVPVGATATLPLPEPVISRESLSVSRELTGVFRWVVLPSPSSPLPL